MGLRIAELRPDCRYSFSALSEGAYNSGPTGPHVSRRTRVLSRSPSLPTSAVLSG